MCKQRTEHPSSGLPIAILWPDDLVVAPRQAVLNPTFPHRLMTNLPAPANPSRLSQGAQECVSVAVGGLVALLRDRAADAALAQVGTVRAGAVRLVGANLVRPGTRTARPEPRHPDTAQDHLELRGVTALSGRDHQRHRLLGLLDRQVQLGGQPTPGASETVVVRLDEQTTGRLDLQIPGVCRLSARTTSRVRGLTIA